MTQPEPAGSRNRVLVCSNHVPHRHGERESNRILQFLDFLQDAGWTADFLAADGVGPARDVQVLRERSVIVHDGAENRIDELFTNTRFDLALMGSWRVAERYLEAIRRVSPNTRVIVDSAGLDFVTEARSGLQRRDDGGANRLDAQYASRLTREINVCAAADGVLTLSPQEATLIGDLTGNADLAYVVPDGEGSSASPRAFGERRGILALPACDGPSNGQAAAVFCSKILPRIDQAVLAVHPTYIVGGGLDGAVAAHGCGLPHVQIVGWVPSLDPYFERVRASVVPGLPDAETRRRLLQSLMMGIPVVATSAGVEGLDLRDRDHILVADDPESFAASITRLLEDEELWCHLSHQGRARIARTHSPHAARSFLMTAVSSVVVKTARTQAPEVVARTEKPPGPVSRKEDSDEVKLIAFYLPQYHPIPENDEWRGPGFTDWTNVSRARPLFPGHYQPRLPRDLGFYDLRLAAVRRRQAELASEHGIYGFCYYHYWFNGRRLLERPFDEVLQSGEPDFPFCLCWANEPWRRERSGTDEDVLQPQTYSEADDRNHLAALLPALTDRRAITVDGQPLFLVYRPLDLPNPARTIATWRSLIRAAGLPGIHLVAVEHGQNDQWDPIDAGFDASVLFQPQLAPLGQAPRIPVDGRRLRVYDYQSVWASLAQAPRAPDHQYETAIPGWDNTGRIGEDAVVLHNATPEAYESWLQILIARAAARSHEHRFVFINAWNGWAEGCYLEPDIRSGRAYLQATRRALEQAAPTRGASVVRAIPTEQRLQADIARPRDGRG